MTQAVALHSNNGSLALRHCLSSNLLPVCRLVESGDNRAEDGHHDLAQSLRDVKTISEAISTGANAFLYKVRFGCSAQTPSRPVAPPAGVSIPGVVHCWFLDRPASPDRLDPQLDFGRLHCLRLRHWRLHKVRFAARRRTTSPIRSSCSQYCLRFHWHAHRRLC